MVLASSSATLTLTQLAEMADRIVEVANPPTVAPVTTAGSSVDEMHQLMDTLSCLVALDSPFHHSWDTPQLRASPAHHTCHLVFRHAQPCAPPAHHPIVGTTGSLEPEPTSAASPAPFREMNGPATSGDECHWPSPESPVLHQWCELFSDTSAEVSVLPPSGLPSSC